MTGNQQDAITLALSILIIHSRFSRFHVRKAVPD